MQGCDWSKMATARKPEPKAGAETPEWDTPRAKYRAAEKIFSNVCFHERDSGTVVIHAYRDPTAMSDI